MASLLPLQIVSVCLILGFAIIHQAATVTTLKDVRRKLKHAEFGCNFEDDNYRTIRTEREGHIIWGAKPVTRKFEGDHITNPKDSIGWEDFKNQVKDIVNTTMTSSRLNNMDPFIRFVKDFKKESEKSKKSLDLQSFYISYNVPYMHEENPAGILIDIFHEMAKANQKNKTNWTREIEPYLATAYVEPKNDVLFDSPTQPTLHEHMAGVIKISLGKRIGYLLIDPGYFNDVILTPFAVVLMEDQERPHQEIIWGNKKIMENIKFTMVGSPNTMWVQATYGTYPQGSAVKHVVYYLGQAYCSFLESTTKPLLLRPHKGMITFDKFATPVAFFTFRVQKTEQIRLGQYNDYKTMVAAEAHDLKLTDLLPENVRFSEIQKDPLVHLKKNVQKKVSQSCDLLKMTLTDLVTRMEFAYDNIYKDRTFYDLWERVARSNIGPLWKRDLRDEPDDDEMETVPKKSQEKQGLQN